MSKAWNVSIDTNWYTCPSPSTTWSPWYTYNIDDTATTAVEKEELKPIVINININATIIVKIEEEKEKDG